MIIQDMKPAAVVLMKLKWVFTWRAVGFCLMDKTDQVH